MKLAAQVEAPTPDNVAVAVAVALAYHVDAPTKLDDAAPVLDPMPEDVAVSVPDTDAEPVADAVALASATPVAKTDAVPVAEAVAVDITYTIPPEANGAEANGRNPSIYRPIQPQASQALSVFLLAHELNQLTALLLRMAYDQAQT